jgi:FemAB-related protein (PEP-CTERM system-associated)
MNVRKILNGEQDRWDEFVRVCEHSTPKQLFGWKTVMEEVFNSETHYFLAEENGEITGVLPLIHIKSLIAGHYVTSFPGGLCAKDDRTAGALLDQAKELVKAVDASYLILRDGRKKWELPKLVTDTEHVTFLIEITPDLKQTKRAFDKRTRNKVNQSTRNGLKAVASLANLDEYYPIFTKAMQELGTPTQGLAFFKSVAANLPNTTDLITIYDGDKVLGGGFFSPFKQMIYAAWAGMLRDYYHLRISHLLYWETVRYAHQKGYRCVDLGRCRKNSGGFIFKKGFGGQVQQLYQQFFLNGIKQPPNVGTSREENLEYRLFVSMWRKLPQPITELLGPELRRRIPFG